MNVLLPILGIAASFVLLYKRQYVGDMIGEADWMLKVGGVYNVMIIVAVLIFFWSIATLTGTSNILFLPLTWLIPGARQGN